MCDLLHGYGLLCWVQRDQTIISLGVNFSMNLFFHKVASAKHVKGTLRVTLSLQSPAAYQGGAPAIPGTTMVPGGEGEGGRRGRNPL